MTPTLSVQFFTRPGGARLDYAPVIGVDDKVAWSQSLGGGLAGLDVSLSDPARAFPGTPYTRARLPSDPFIMPFAHIEVRLGGALVWDGRLVKRNWGGGWLSGVTGMGYGYAGLADTYYTSASTTPVTTGTIIKEALATTTFVGAGNTNLFTDPGVLHAPLDFDLMTPAQVIDQVASEGDGTAAFDWWVAVGGFLALRRRDSPATPDYVLALDAHVTTYEEDDTNLYGSVQVYFSPTATGTATVLTAGTSVVVTHDLGVTPVAGDITLTSTSTLGAAKHFWISAVSSTTFTIATDVAPGGAGASFSYTVAPKASKIAVQTNTAFTARFPNLTRSVAINGGQLTFAGATALAAAELGSRGQSNIAVSLDYTLDESLQLAQGGQLPAYLVTVGKWLTVGGGRSLQVRTVAVDWSARRVRIEAGTVDPSAGIRGAARITNAVAQLAVGINPKTRGKWTR